MLLTETCSCSRLYGIWKFRCAPVAPVDTSLHLRNMYVIHYEIVRVSKSESSFNQMNRLFFLRSIANFFTQIYMNCWFSVDKLKKLCKFRWMSRQVLTDMKKVYDNLIIINLYPGSTWNAVMYQCIYETRLLTLRNAELWRTTPFFTFTHRILDFYFYFFVKSLYIKLNTINSWLYRSWLRGVRACQPKAEI